MVAEKSDNVQCKRVWLALSGLAYRDTVTNLQKVVLTGEEVTNIDQGDLAGYLKRGLVKQEFVEA